MGDDFATVALTRKTWASVFLGQLGYLYAMVLERSEWDEGSDQWNYYQRALRDAIDSYMPMLKEASLIDPELDEQWFEFKLVAGIFNSEALEDNAKQIVYITAAD